MARHGAPRNAGVCDRPCRAKVPVQGYASRLGVPSHCELVSGRAKYAMKIVAYADVSSNCVDRICTSRRGAPIPRTRARVRFRGAVVKACHTAGIPSVDKVARTPAYRRYDRPRAVFRKGMETATD